MIKYLTLLILLIFSNSIKAELFVKKKVQFNSCEQLIQTGNYKGERNYTLYNENNEPFEEYCETPYYSSCKEIYNQLQTRLNGVYEIINNNKIYPVYCNMTDNGGGWTMVVAQYENNPIPWDEGRQPDYDPSLETKQSFALSNEDIPQHSEISYGQDLNLKQNVAFNHVYQTGNIPITEIINKYDNVSFYIHRNESHYFADHRARPTARKYYSDQWTSTLTIDSTAVSNAFAFSRKQNGNIYTGYAYDGRRDSIVDTNAWVVWVR
tara:strand:+ start:385 stop:1179 length:795 start_codon:yes stop_codon:yes gene_type:complete